MPKRFALGCSNKNSYHQFRHPEKNPDHFRAWVHIAGGKLDCPADYELYRKKVICDIHFTNKDRNRNDRLNFLAVPPLRLTGKFDEVGTSKKVLLVPKTVIEDSSLATLKSTLTGKFDEVGTSKKVLLVPKPVIEDSSLATLKPTLTGKSDEIVSSEKVLLAHEPVNEESSLAIFKPILTYNCATIISSEHNFIIADWRRKQLLERKIIISWRRCHHSR